MTVNILSANANHTAEQKVNLLLVELKSYMTMSIDAERNQEFPSVSIHLKFAVDFTLRKVFHTPGNVVYLFLV